MVQAPLTAAMGTFATDLGDFFHFALRAVRKISWTGFAAHAGDLSLLFCVHSRESTLSGASLGSCSHLHSSWLVSLRGQYAWYSPLRAMKKVIKKMWKVLLCGQCIMVSLI